MQSSSAPTAAAADVWERYRQRLTWAEVTFGPDGTSVTPPSRGFECLVGRSEAMVVQINNQTRQGLNVDVSGQAGDTPIRASQTFVPPNSTECACVLVTVAAPGPLKVRLQCNAGALNTAVQCSGLAKPSCRLTIQLVDAATGRPTAARAFVRTEDGRTLCVTIARSIWRVTRIFRSSAMRIANSWPSCRQVLSTSSSNAGLNTN